MTIRHSHAYEKLALVAGLHAGLKKPTAESVAEDGNAVQLRDALYADYERQMRDTQTYTLEAILSWLKENDVKVSMTAIFRDRRCLLMRERMVTLAAGKARAVIEAAAESGEHDLLRGGRLMAGQLLFEALSNLSPESLSGMTPTQILSMVNTLGLLSKSHAETDLIRAKLAEMKRKFDEQIAAASGKTKDGKLTAEMIGEVRRAVFGAAA